MDSVSAPQFLEHISHSLTYTPFEFKWIPCSPRFMVVGQTPRAKGIIQLYKMREGNIELSHEVSILFNIILSSIISGLKIKELNVLRLELPLSLIEN